VSAARFWSKRPMTCFHESSAMIPRSSSFVTLTCFFYECDSLILIEGIETRKVMPGKEKVHGRINRVDLRCSDTAHFARRVASGWRVILQELFL
jgi:hypothetical protein